MRSEFNDCTVGSPTGDPRALGTQGKKLSPSQPVHRNELRRLATNLYQHVDEIFQKGIKRHPFIDRFERHIGKQDIFEKFVREAFETFERSILDSPRPQHQSSIVPPFTHRIWVTSKTVPNFPPEEYIAECLKAARKMPHDATHFFWTNSDAVRAHLQSQFVIHGVANGVVMDIDSLGPSVAMQHARRLLMHRKFVLAADLIKIIVLHKFGGIYADFGVFYNNDIFQLVKFNDYTFLIGDGNFLQSSFLAAPPDSSLLNAFLGIIAEPAALDSNYALMSGHVSALDEVHLFAGPGLTVCALLFLSRAARVIVLPPQSESLSWRAQQSWYGSVPKHGNVLVEQTPPSVIEAASFAMASKFAEQRLTIFGNDASMRERLRALLILHAHFRENPTETCRLFYFYGSDKAIGWHNYGYIYHFFLLSWIKNPKYILEIGVGAETLDAMPAGGQSAVVGTSLRAWRERFSGSDVTGAEIANRSLICDPGLQIVFLDASTTDKITEFFVEFGEKRFEIIVDDGLHEFETNRRLLEVGLAWLSPGGVYVIEDIPGTEIAQWRDYLGRQDFPAAILKIPHPTNGNDNNIVVICPPASSEP